MVALTMRRVGTFMTTASVPVVIGCLDNTDTQHSDTHILMITEPHSSPTSSTTLAT